MYTELRRVIVVLCSVSLVVTFWSSFYLYWNQKFSPLEVERVNGTFKLLINSSKCALLAGELMPEYWRQRWDTLKRPNCEGRGDYAYLTEEKMLIRNELYENSSCYLRPIVRPPRNDTDGRYLQPINLSSVTNVSGIEMFSIHCSHRKQLNFGANVIFPKEGTVQAKVIHWKDQILPLNVLVLGLDSTSRSHMLRSFPKTVELFRQLGFTDFRGHHSVSPYSNRNFFAILAGYTMRDVGKKCVQWWSIRWYDGCPWIWKEYSQAKYVTMYLEDREQSFNSPTDRTGFAEPPTDYYIHPVLIEMHKHALNLTGGDPKADDCASSRESVPQFLLSYLRKFASAVQDQVPFFTFTFLGSPFHEFQLSHQNFDEDFFKFFKFLNSSGILQKTIVIFTADHGDRAELFTSYDVEGYLERSLPPLYVHLPDSFTQQHPEMTNALEFNSHVLTSHFDIHHTLRHILFLQGLGGTIHGQPDRSSLLQPTLTPRSCADMHVEPGMCVCGVGLHKNVGEDPHTIQKLLLLSINKLNQIVQNSTYGSQCEVWKPEFLPLSNTKLVIASRSGNNFNGILTFRTVPEADFQVRVMVQRGSSMRISGEFERKNKYGNSSSCIKISSPRDYRLRELCLCKT